MLNPVRNRVAGLIATFLLGAASIAAAQAPAAPTNVTVVAGGSVPFQGKQWTIADDGHFVQAENAVLKLKFAYNAQNYQGWFTGTRSSTGGGGRDGSIVELYYKPTSATRNLIFRNGTWGSGYDSMDLFEAEYQGGTYDNFNAPDYQSGLDAVMNSHSVTENAGRLIARFDFQFAAWRIVRTYTVYPWGEITVTSQLTVTQTSNWNFLGHRFSFGVSPYSFSNGTATYNWGGNYRPASEHYHAWTDGAPGGVISENFYEYDKGITTSINENSFPYNFGRRDQYSGFLLDDANGDDPDIVVFPGDRTIWESPFQQIPRKLGTADGIGAYIETALFNISWAPSSEAVAQMTYFYMTTPSNQISVQTTWPTSLGTWQEVFHVLFRRKLASADYLPLWKTYARDIATQPLASVSGGTASLNAADGLYHVAASSGTTKVQFSWTRPAAATNAIDYRTAFVVEGFDPTSAQIQGTSAPALDVYYDAASHTTLLVLSGPQPATQPTYTIVLTK